MARNPLKQLAGETAIYGLSTILARFVNFMLVPVYTNVLTTSDYGVVTEFMSYIALLQVVLVMGLETGCFRYASKEGANPQSVFSNAFMSVLSLCLLFFGCTALWSGDIAESMGYEGHANVIIYVAAILALDCPLAIVFAKLRHEHKALRFAVIKTLKILTEVGANLVLYFVMPPRFAANPSHFLLNFVSPSPDYTYAIFAIFLSCVVCLLMLLGELFRLRYRFDAALMRKLLVYSLPLMVAGLPGILNDFIDRILMRFVNADPVMWRADLGVYQAGVKIAVLMQLFSQMFRYAAEPFFFQREKDKGGKQIYARVLEYFTAFCMVGFVVILLYMDVIGLLIGRDFREGLSIAPIMLMAYILTGILFNVNMWYKLAEKTSMAVWITLAGLAVSVATDITWMPVYSYRAAAWGHIASYGTMLLLTALLGRKYYPIPYNWGFIGLIVALGIGIWGMSMMLPHMALLPRLLVHTLLIMIYIAALAGLFFLKKRRHESEISQ